MVCRFTCALAQLGFRVLPQPTAERFTLTQTLLRRGGCCLGRTSVYVCAGAVLGLPVRPILFEGHVASAYTTIDAMRYIEPSRGERVSRCASRPTARGESPTGGELLADAEFLALHLSSRAAFVFAPNGRLEDAVALLDAALELYPGYLGAWINRAAVLLEMGERGLAGQSLRRAMSLCPGRRYGSVVARLAARLGENFGGAPPCTSGFPT